MGEGGRRDRRGEGGEGGRRDRRGGGEKEGEGIGGGKVRRRVNRGRRDKRGRR